MSVLKLYTLENCSTCREAVSWLRGRGGKFSVHPIRTNPPTVPELERLLAAYGGERRKLFNTAGRDYRAQGIAARQAEMSDAEALRLLAGNGSLMKRPVLLGPGVALVGFSAATWAEAVPLA